MNPNDLPAASTLTPLDLLPASSCVVVELVALSERGRRAHFRLPGPSERMMVADSMVDLQARDIGREVMVMVMDHGLRAVVIGVIQPIGLPAETPAGQVNLEADGRRLVVSADHELVLRCGQASLVLRQDGSIELKGTSILTQAEGAQRIRGGSIQLN
jgi:hypothetical protein